MPTTSTPIRTITPGASRSRTRTALQVFGFVLGLAALAYCIYLVVSNPTYLQQLARLGAAPAWLLAALFALSAAATATSGMVFRATLKPVRIITIADGLAINAFCTLLGNVPFKLSLIARIVLHKTRHHLALGTILSWFAGTALVILISLAPPLATTLWLGEFSVMWWLTTIAGTAALGITCVLLARRFAPPDRWASFTHRLPRLLQRLAHLPFAIKLQHGLRTVASPWAMAEALCWRGMDLAAQVIRFWLVAQALGVEMTWAQCMIAATTYFFIQSASPTGALGAREGLTAAILTAAGAHAITVVLAVSVVESITNIFLGLAGGAYLRVDRLLLSRNQPLPRGDG